MSRGKTLSDMTETELRQVMIDAANKARTALPEGTRIVLLAFDDSQIAQYIATVERAGVIKILREAADRLENREDVTR